MNQFILSMCGLLAILVLMFFMTSIAGLIQTHFDLEDTIKDDKERDEYGQKSNKRRS